MCQDKLVSRLIRKGTPRVGAGTDGRGPKCHDRLVSRLIRKGTPRAGAGKDARGPKCHNTISFQP